MIRLKDFTSLCKAEFYLVLAWRNDERIAPFMHSKQISFNEHLKFFEELKFNTNKKYFLVYDDEEILGVISFVKTKQIYEFGLYQNPNLKGFGKILMQEILNHAFLNLKLKKLNAKVLKSNQKALNLYLNFGFKIYKEDKDIFYITHAGGGL